MRDLIEKTPQGLLAFLCRPTPPQHKISTNSQGERLVAEIKAGAVPEVGGEPLSFCTSCCLYGSFEPAADAPAMRKPAAHCRRWQHSDRSAQRPRPAGTKRKAQAISPSLVCKHASESVRSCIPTGILGTPRLGEGAAIARTRKLS